MIQSSVISAVADCQKELRKDLEHFSKHKILRFRHGMIFGLTLRDYMAFVRVCIFAHRPSPSKIRWKRDWVSELHWNLIKQDRIIFVGFKQVSLELLHRFLDVMKMWNPRISLDRKFHYTRTQLSRACHCEASATKIKKPTSVFGEIKNETCT